MFYLLQFGAVASGRSKLWAKEGARLKLTFPASFSSYINVVDRLVNYFFLTSDFWWFASQFLLLSPWYGLSNKCCDMISLFLCQNLIQLIVSSLYLNVYRQYYYNPHDGFHGFLYHIIMESFHCKNYHFPVRHKTINCKKYYTAFNKQWLDEVEHDMMNYPNRGLSYLPQPSASADNTDTRFW